MSESSARYLQTNYSTLAQLTNNTYTAREQRKQYS